MPSKTKKQAKAFKAACHDPKTRKKMGVSKKMACEWHKKDKRKKK